MRIYVVREVAGNASGFVPRRVVERLEGPTSGPSLLAMYDLDDVGATEVALPSAGVEVGVGSRVGEVGWGPQAWEQFDAGIERARIAWGEHPGARWVWPRAGEVLSDVPSIRRFLKAREGEAWRFVLDPVAMLVESMAADAEEHVRRMLEMLGSHEACGAVVLSDLRGQGLAPVAIGTGDLSRRGLLEWYRANCGPDLAVILGVDGDLTGQVAWLTSG